MEKTIWPIEQHQLTEILRDPNSAKKDPYLLYISYTWNKLKEFKYDEFLDVDDLDDYIMYEELDISMMGINAETLYEIMRSCAEDIVAAQDNGLVIKIEGKPYRLSRTVKADPDVMMRLFQFKPAPYDSSILIMNPGLVMTPYDPNAKIKDEASELKESRTYFHKIVWLVENDEDGWDKLTDIEAAAYIWGMKMARYEGRMTKGLMKETIKVINRIKRDIGRFTLDDIFDYWNADFTDSEVAVESQFSVSKMREWNNENNQKSVVDKVDKDLADDFWYITGRETIYGKNM